MLGNGRCRGLTQARTRRRNTELRHEGPEGVEFGNQMNVFVPLFAVQKIANGRGARTTRRLEILLPVIYAFLVIFNFATAEVSWMTAMWAALCVAYVFMARKMRTLRKLRS